jgi:S-adenosylmethionine:tRNA ribosyltransferase-isomerase
MNTDLFNYSLPEGQIAQHSVEPRDHSRLMALDRRTGTWKHKQFFEIADELGAGDVLVFNDTKVFRARLKTKDGLEMFLLRATDGRKWETLMRPGKKILIGQKVDNFPRSRKVVNSLSGVVLEKKSDGVVMIEFDQPPHEVISFANENGEIPIPPYVRERPSSLDQYQTIYAKEIGSVAAPTAGFHFTKCLMDELRVKNVQFEFVTLHVGLGTFRPMKSQTLEAHKMHSELVSIDEQTAQRINQAKREGRRVIAVGTTTVRTLEGIDPIHVYTGDMNLFIKPGFDFKIIDGLITNFHLPKSTLLVLVCAFAGREHILAAYKEAIKQHYRFFSFGDAMFIR